jgi:pimeloyl-ACP methyl ester carboxylesterase
MRAWIEEQRSLAGRVSRRYASPEEALRRMQDDNGHLTADQARHLTGHGIRRNADGSYGWKFDNYVRSQAPADMTQADLEYLWGRIACPTLLVYGRESWASNPAEDGRARHFRDARVVSVEGAGHWVHHDRLEAFVAEVRGFLSA